MRFDTRSMTYIELTAQKLTTMTVMKVPFKMTTVSEDTKRSPCAVDLKNYLINIEH